MIDFPLIWESLPSLLQATLVSLEITTIAMGFGLLLGVILALAETSSWRLLRYAAGAYVMLFRGTPMLVQIMFVFYVLPQFGIMIPPFFAASLAIGLNSGAYMSQVFRGGIEAVDKGQMEAAQTLGLSKWAALRYIVMPQAFRVALPALGNELVTLVKDSSLASIIGVVELSREASFIRSRTYDAFSIMLTISLIYMALTATLSGLVHLYEKRMKKHA